jgi:hypothetical protein
VAFQNAELQVAPTLRSSPEINLDANIDPPAPWADPAAGLLRSDRQLRIASAPVKPGAAPGTSKRRR